MLDLGFIHALKQIVKMLPAKRQTLFFSATMPKAIKEPGRQVPGRSRPGLVAPSATTAERVDQYVTFVQQAEKQALLTMMLRHGFSERGNMDRVLIFARTKHGADRVVKLLAGNGIVANAIHGNKSQPQRERALDGFRAGRPGSWWRPTSPRAGSTSHGVATSSTTTCPTCPRNTSTASVAPPAPGPGSPSPSAPMTKRLTCAISRS